MKFNEHKDTLLNRHVSLRLRYHFNNCTWSFDMSIDFESTSTTRSGEKPYATFNCWMDWHELMQKMNRKLENVQQIFNVRSWIERLLVGRFRCAAKIASGMNSWASITSEWHPYQRWQMSYCVEPRRRIGRPAKRWDDQMQSFAQEIFHSSWFQAAKCQTWSSHEESFCTVVLGTLMFGCSCFPCPSRTVALTRTGIVCLCVCVDLVSIDIVLEGDLCTPSLIA